MATQMSVPRSHDTKRKRRKIAKKTYEEPETTPVTNVEPEPEPEPEEEPEAENEEEPEAENEAEEEVEEEEDTTEADPTYELPPVTPMTPGTNLGDNQFLTEKIDREALNRPFVVKSVVANISLPYGIGSPPRLVNLSNEKIPKNYINLIHKPFSTNKSSTLVKYPKYIFDSDEINFDGAVDESSPITCFSDKEKLLPLKDICKKLNIDLQMLHTSTGELLRKLTWGRTQCVHRKMYMNDTRFYPLEYYLVYGAVPKKMETAASYFLKQLEKNYDSFPEKHKRVAMISGEIELMTFSYWEISSDDLRFWRNDTACKPLKLMLAKAWAALPKDKDSDLVKLRQRILDYANFNNNDYITAQCLMYIKYRYEKIISYTPDIYVPLWHNFMRAAKIHHYLCPHTIREIYANLTRASCMLKSRYNYMLITERDTNYNIISKSECFKLLVQRYVNAESQISKDLQKAINNLVCWMLKSMALTVVDLGIYRSEITEEHISGIFKEFKLYDAMVVNQTFSQTVKNNIISFFSQMVYLEKSKMIKLKITEPAKETLIQAVYMLLSSSIVSCMFTDMDIKESKCSKYLTRAIRDFIEERSCGTNPNLWVADDCHDKEVNFEELTSESEECSSESDYDSDVSLDGEKGISLEEKRATEFKKSEDKYKNLIQGRHVPVKQQLRLKKSDIIGRFEYCKGHISRIPCVLCNLYTTEHLLKLSDKLEVPSCHYCTMTINKFSTKEQDACVTTIYRRTFDNNYKPPLLFKILPGDRREYLESSELCTGRTKFSYNYIVRRESEIYKKMINNKKNKKVAK